MISFAAAAGKTGFEEGPGARTFLNLAGGSTAMPGWVVTGEGIDLVGAGYWRSSEGTYAIDLDGSARSRATPPHVQGGIAQTFATVGGKRYRVTFDLAGNPTVADLLLPAGYGERRVAVEINREVVPRSLHAARRVAEGDVVEIIHAIGGG